MLFRVGRYKINKKLEEEIPAGCSCHLQRDFFPVLLLQYVQVMNLAP